MRQVLWESEPRNHAIAPIRSIGVTHAEWLAVAAGGDTLLDVWDPARRCPAGTARDRDAPAADLCDAQGSDFEAVLAASVGEEFVA